MGSDAKYYNLSYPTVILTFSWYTLFLQTRQWRTNHRGITVQSEMDEIPSQNMPVQRLKAEIPPLDLPCSGLVTYSGEINYGQVSQDESRTDYSQKTTRKWKRYYRLNTQHEMLES